MARNGIDEGAELDLEGGPDAVLLLHGLTGSPFEVAPVARRLAEAGFRCLAPVMAGHGGPPEELIGVPWSEWVDKASRDLGRLAGARRTFVVGCSMGALVACALAHDEPARVDGLVLLAPALELRLSGKLAALAGSTAAFSGTVLAKRKGSDVRDLEMRRRNPCMTGVALGAVSQLVELQRHVDRLLPGIPVSALVFMGSHDHTVTMGGALRLARRIGSGPAELVVLERSWHLVGVDVERDRVAELSLRFLEGLPLPGTRIRPRPTRRTR